jgi:hypothetical protein
LREPRRPKEVKASLVFKSFYSKLDKDGRLYKIVETSIGDLRKNMCAGTKIEKKKFPKKYVKKYGITNLWKINLDSGYRLIYTIIAEESFKIPVVLEVLPHKEYARKFGYGTD